ncbi:MAG: class II aldolase/adducin family protein, partial [Proteobacteria bacterium]|nr:class II aldolase/adducin family protein [Pseudomonadota bacterium]
PAAAGAVAATASPVAPEDVREQIVDAVQELYRAELITATGGNVSARIADADEVWITPSQLFKGELRPEVLVRIDLEGHSLDVGSRSPSSEWGVHCAIYRARPDIVAVVHAHAPHATILANAGLPFLPISTEAAFFSDLPRLPFIMPGTGELAAAVAEAMADSWAVLMVNHGLIVGGRTLRRAADMIEIIDRSAQVILGCYAVGREPPTLPDDVVATLRKMGDLVA